MGGHDLATLVLVYNLRRNPASAARLHAPSCGVIENSAKLEGVRIVQGLVALQHELERLHAEVIPVRLCPCVRRKSAQ
jgi:hypothetical protein